MSTRRLLRSTSAALVASVLACAPACAPAPAAHPLAVPPAPPPVPHPPDLPPAWTYWEPLDATVHGKAVAPPLPLAEVAIAMPGGAAARWAALPENDRIGVLSNGFALVPHATPTARFGEWYAALAGARVPYLVTLDALFWVAHVARDRALAAAEETVLAPALTTLLRRLEIRLGSESRGAPGDLVVAYGLARGVVSVARSLLSPGYHPPVDLARVVAEENRRILAHEGPSMSPLLGVTVDYSEIVPRGAADASAARAAYARAAAWLGAAPFELVARGESEGAELSISAARAHARAALLVARLVQFEVDVEAAYAWHQWSSLAELAGGRGDDVSLRGLAGAAASVGMNVRDLRAIVDVAKLDRLRHALAAGRAPRVSDGAAIAGVTVHHGEAASSNELLRAATSVRVLPPRGAGDADLLQALVFPSVGKWLAAGAPPPATARDGVRALPRALDVAAWLGAPDARALLHDSGDDAYERYGSLLDQLSARRPADAQRHDSVYASSLDALGAYVAPSAADPEQPFTASPAWSRRRLETALAGWTTLRHDALAFARFPLATSLPLPPASLPHAGGATAGTTELVDAGAGDLATSGFVEPHPEAIGKLLSLVRQASRGLRALGDLPPSSPANAILDGAEGLLADAFVIARREADDEPPSADERAAIATIPARLASLEAALVPSHAADASLAVDVHTDFASSHALVEGCGDLDDLYVAFREPQTGRIVLAVGAASSHYEVTEPLRDRPTDAVWRSRLHGPSPPARPDYARALFSSSLPERDAPDASLAD